MNVTKEREKQQTEYINAILAVALTYGVTKQTIKREAFSSYATGNRRIEHEQGDISLENIANIARLCRISILLLNSQALQILQNKGVKIQ